MPSAFLVGSGTERLSSCLSTRADLAMCGLMMGSFDSGGGSFVVSCLVSFILFESLISLFLGKGRLGLGSRRSAAVTRVLGVLSSSLEISFCGTSSERHGFLFERMLMGSAPASSEVLLSEVDITVAFLMS